MTKIVQFGEGNFLRTFVDAYFDHLNRYEGASYEVHIVKPIAFGDIKRFAQQNNRYHIVLRGQSGGVSVEQVCPIDCIASVIDPFSDIEAYFALARDPEVKLIVSNTTEAGICYHESDPFDGFDGITFPAKLTKFLYARFEAGLDGVCLLPVELIDHNADELHACVDAYIARWGLGEAFRTWNNTQNVYCNTLVDRIVSGYPRDEQTRAHLTELIGEEDLLMSVGEPFGLWAVENKGPVAEYIKDGVHNIEVVLTDDIGYYKKRKVRVLNGSHTNLVPFALLHGCTTVYDAMQNEQTYAFFKEALQQIIPHVSADVSATEAFAAAVEERFFNPYLNHQLWSIALNSLSKWRARVLPTFTDDYHANGRLPTTLATGFACLLYLYQTRTDEVQDEPAYIEAFRRGIDVRACMADASIWGEDLTQYKGFVSHVEQTIERLREGAL